MPSIRPIRERGLRAKDIIIFDEQDGTAHVFSVQGDLRTPPSRYSRPGAFIAKPIFPLLTSVLIAPPFNGQLETVSLRDGLLLRCLESPTLPSNTRHKISISLEDVNTFLDAQGEKTAESARFVDMRQYFDSVARDVVPNGVKILSWILENFLGVTIREELTKDVISWSFLVL